MIDQEQGTGLDVDFENGIIRRAQGGDIDARNALIEHHLPFIRLATARAVAGRGEPEEYLGLAVEYFIRAVSNFDTDRGFRLTTYAHKAIVHGLRRAHTMGGLISTPYATPSEANRHKAERARRHVSIHQEEGEQTWMIPDRAGGSGDAPGELREALTAALRSLETRQFDIVMMRARGMTFQAIANRLGLTKERVRQCEAEAIVALRERAGTDELNLPLVTISKIGRAAC